MGTSETRSRYIEPFHLQLICQRIERIAASEQNVSGGEIVLGLKDLGGAASLTETLAAFYASAIRSLPEKYLRNVVRRLCEHYLISPEGRRLSLDEREIGRQLRLSSATLARLVESRLLRTDRRSDSTYYELSHDALVEPVLAGRRAQAMFVAWAQIIAGCLLCLVAGLYVVVLVVVVVMAFTQKDAPSQTPYDKSGAAIGSVIIGVLVLIVAPGMFFGGRWARAGALARRRYRRRVPGEFDQPISPLQPWWRRFPLWVILGAGSGVAGTVLLYLGTWVFALAYYLKTHRVWGWVTEDLQRFRGHPFVEIPWTVGQLAVDFAAGCIAILAAYRRLWPGKVVPVPGQQHFLSSAILRTVSGGIVLTASLLAGIIFAHCVSAPGGTPPGWLSSATVIDDIARTCTNTAVQNGTDLSDEPLKTNGWKPGF